MATVLAAGLAQAQPATGSISGRLGLKNDGSALTGAKVTLDAPGQHVETSTDESGLYRFGNLSAGTYQLHLPSPRVIEVDLAAGEQLKLPDIELPIPRICQPPLPLYFKLLRLERGTAAVSGSVSAAGFQIRLDNPKDRNRTTQTDSSGRFEFRELPAGTYRLWIHRDGFPWVDTGGFDLAPGWEAVYSPPPLPADSKPIVCE